MSAQNINYITNRSLWSIIFAEEYSGATDCPKMCVQPKISDQNLYVSGINKYMSVWHAPNPTYMCIYIVHVISYVFLVCACVRVIDGVVSVV